MNKIVETAIGPLIVASMASVLVGGALIADHNIEPKYRNSIEVWAASSNPNTGSAGSLSYHDKRDIGNKKLFVDKYMDGTLDYVVVGLEPWVGRPGELFRREDPEFAKYLSEFENIVRPMATLEFEKNENWRDGFKKRDIPKTTGRE